MGGYNEKSSAGFGHVEDTCDPRPEQVQEWLLMNDLSWSDPELWAKQWGENRSLCEIVHSCSPPTRGLRVFWGDA